MKKFFSAIALILSLNVFSQNKYWQQEVNYNINVSLNDKDHSLKGLLNLEYVNNSPDELNFIWFHLWPNAYKNENTAFAKQLFRESDGKKRWKAIKDKGYIDSLNFTAEGVKLNVEPHPEDIDVVKVLLPSSLKPGQKINISTPFHVKLASYNSRSGYDGQSYIVTQWYPKPAVYDRKGWHPMPYLDQGEFYSEFGKFNVNINVPTSYIVGATGVLQTKDELEQYKKIGTANLKAKSRSNTISYVPQSSTFKTLNFTGDNIHDFAWFADKNFVIRYDTMQLGSEKIVDVFSYHHPKGNAHWVNSIDYLKSGVRSYSSYLGEYTYPTVAAVEGPKNDMSGGMEYPMITLITSPTANEEYLDAVITHEIGHNWFYGMLASNERVHAWMDEGLNSYYQFRYEAEKYRSSSIFGDMLPKELKLKPVDEFLAIIYQVMSNNLPMDEAIDTHSASFKNKESYGIVSYVKTAIWMYILELSFGKEKLDNAMKAYFNQWKFKHPYPEDLKAVFEKEFGQDMTPFFDSLKKKGKL